MTQGLSKDIAEWASRQFNLIGNFEGTYHGSSSAYDPNNYIQEESETVCQFIASWLKKHNSLTDVSDEQAILAFINGCRSYIFAISLA